MRRQEVLFVPLVFLILSVFACQDPTIPQSRAKDDSYETNMNTVLEIVQPGVLINDETWDEEGDNESVTLVSGPENGTLTLDVYGGFIYTPNEDFTGTDSFTYRFCPTERCQAVVEITVTGVAELIEDDSGTNSDQAQPTQDNQPTDDSTGSEDNGGANSEQAQPTTIIATATSTTLPTSTPTNTAPAPPTDTGATTQVFPVYYCTYIGGEQFEWYEVEVTYQDGVAVSERVVSGPYTGSWQPGCPGIPTNTPVPNPTDIPTPTTPGPTAVP